MKILDYGTSYIHGKAATNRVRFWVESVTRIIDERNNTREDFYQCGACKSENTFAEENLFRTDNYDFTPIFGPRDSVIFRRHAHLGQGYRDIRASEQMWDGQIYRVQEGPNAQLLDSNSEILEATHRSRPLVACTEIWNVETGLRASIQYPVKTMNILDEKQTYQVDTGPVAWPDLSRRYSRLVESISLAFVAFNVQHFADFVIEAPTPIAEKGQELCRVYHYSRLVSQPAKNQLYSLQVSA